MRALGMILGLCFAAGAAKAQFAPVDIATFELAEGVYQFTVAADGYVEQLNSVAIVNDHDVLVFDTTTRPSTARSIIAKIRAITSKPVRFVVNSHWHPDHWSGNEAFAAEFPGVEIIATEQERDFMLNMAALWPKTGPQGLAAAEKEVARLLAEGKDEYDKPLTPQSRARIETELRLIRDRVTELLQVKRTYPNVTYTDRMVLHRGGREIVLMSVTGDAAANTVLYLPKERILVTGDAVSHPLPYYTPPLAEHSRSLRMLAALEANLIVPGHGPAFRDNAYMLMEAELFETTVERVRQALRSGAVTIDEVQAAVKLDDFRDRFAKGDQQVAEIFPRYASGLIRRAYIELRDTKEIR